MPPPTEAPRVKLFVVTIHHDSALPDETIAHLRESFGQCDLVSEDFPFTLTDYYESEMGTGLHRRFYSFATLISPDRLIEAKKLCNAIEDRYRVSSRRTINLDPGYIDYYKVVLASNKFGGQKIYLADGIFADMTLLMYKGKWESFVWGFPDFKSGSYDAVLNRIRELYKIQLRKQEPQRRREK